MGNTYRVQYVDSTGRARTTIVAAGTMLGAIACVRRTQDGFGVATPNAANPTENLRSITRAEQAFGVIPINED